VREYRGKGWDGVAEVPGRIVRWLGEAVRILGSYPSILLFS